MIASSFFYSIVSRVAAVVLLIAGGLKAQEFLSSPGVVPQWTVLGQTAGELLLGFWLLVGLYPRWSRLVALVCFVVFLNVALAGAVQGQTSCGCFGKVSVRPWSAVGLDALLVVGLLFAPTTQMRELTFRKTRMRWLAFAIPAFLVLSALAWPIMGKAGLGEKHIPTKVSDDMPPSIDASALERVIHNVEQNHAALHMLVYTTETKLTQHPVKWTGTRPMRKGNKTVKVTGTWVEPETEKHSRHVWKTWTRGDEIRQDGLSHYEGEPGGEILDPSGGGIWVSSKRVNIQCYPEIRQATISAEKFSEEGRVNSIDLRCAGFQPPLQSIADWLKNRCEALNVGFTKDRSGREVIRLHARVKHYPNTKYETEYEVAADFVPTMSCMPSRVVYYFLPDGGVFGVTDIEYQQVGASGAWFPRRVAERGFLRNTTADPDAPTGQNLSAESTVKILTSGQGVQDEDFDPILPAQTFLKGDLTAQDETGNVPIRASKVMRAQPRTITYTTPPDQGSAVQKSSWPFVAGMDVLLLGFCLVFRKRLAF